MTLFLIIYYVLLSLSLYKVFEKAGVEGWKALVPVYNFVIWAELAGRSRWHAAWLLVPIVNLFILVGLIIDLIDSFGHKLFWQHVVAVIFAPIYFFYLGFSKDEKYNGPILVELRDYRKKVREARQKGDKLALKKLEEQDPFKKGALREWAEAIIFAVFAAAFIRMFLIEAYMIPTSSMEGSLMTGDFLFVSKVHYGVRTPMTIVMVPLLHNTIPVLGSESYLKKPKLDYHRLPKLEEISHNDPVVFNYPEGDSVFITPFRTWSIYDVRRDPSLQRYVQGKQLRVRPIDKRDHYIKRCIGLPGDTLEIIDRQVHINGKPAVTPPKVQFLYEVTSPNVPLNKSKLSEWGVNADDLRMAQPNKGFFHLNEEQVKKIKALGPEVTVNLADFTSDPNKIFPHDRENFQWTNDNFGPVYIPAKGEQVVITPKNIALYERVIRVYEDNEMDIRKGRIFINGEQTNTYTFKQDYYWMMGDNRHNSEDSRVWGFAPADHIVGKPLFIWFSLKNGSLSSGINWSRIFDGARQM